ncbi:MAG: hypothetical protein KDA85_18495 [Planctomycetaceae bacterium]|nr:hypothetical protein [Planctomycetaceae bacterium]
MNNDGSLPLLPAGASPVPVFNCIIALKTASAPGRIAAEVANLDGISAEGTSERDVLTAVSRQFRDTVRALVQEEQPIPWRDPDPILNNADAVRYIPVHL